MNINDLVASDFPWDVSSLRSTKSRDELLQLLLGAELVAVAALLLAAVHGPSLACFGATHGAKACHMKAY